MRKNFGWLYRNSSYYEKRIDTAEDQTTQAKNFQISDISQLQGKKTWGKFPLGLYDFVYY